MVLEEGNCKKGCFGDELEVLRQETDVLTVNWSVLMITPSFVRLRDAKKEMEI